MDFVLISLATSMFALKGVVAKLAYAEGTSVEALLLVRFLSATPIYWLVGFYKNTLPQKNNWKAYEIGFGALLSVIFFTAAFLDFKALTLMEASLERIILFTFPAFVILYDLILDRKLPPASVLVGFAITELGLCLVLRVFEARLPNIEGCLWALSCAIVYALYLRLSQVATRKHHSVEVNIVSNSFTTVITCTLFFLLTPEAEFGSSLGVTYCIAIGFFCTALPFLLLFEAVKRMGAQRSSLLSMPGPIVTVIAAMILLDEQLGIFQWIGMLVVIIGVTVIQTKPKGFGVGLPRIIRN